MEQLLKGKVALVTGAGSGIGKASAILFAKEGAKVVISNRNEEAGNETVRQIVQNNGEAFFIKADVSVEEDIQELIERSVQKYSSIDCAFNCAGTDGIKKPINELTIEEWEEVINTNLKGTFFLLKYEINQMLKQKTGSTIVNMGSVSGLLGRPGRSSYNASRSGIMSLTKTTAIENIKRNIRINCVAPGAVDTELFKKFTNGDSEKRKQYAEAHPIGRICRPEEVAEATLWLLSDKSSFVVGHELVIDGGFSII